MKERKIATRVRRLAKQYVPDMALGSGAHESEAQLEKKFIQILESQGYEYLNTLTQEADLVSNLRKQMEKLNHVALKEGTFTDGEWKRFYSEILANKKVVREYLEFQGLPKGAKVVDREYKS